jgi:hypothetical protein
VLLLAAALARLHVIITPVSVKKKKKILASGASLMASAVSPPQSWSSIVATSNIITAILPGVLQNINALHRHLVKLSLTKTSTPAADMELLRLLSICGVDTANRVAVRPQAAAAAAAAAQPPPALAMAAPAKKRRWDSGSASAAPAGRARCAIPGCKFKGSHPFIIKLSATRHCHSKFPDNKVPPSIKRIPMISPIPSRGDALQIATEHAEAKGKEEAGSKETKTEEQLAIEHAAAEQAGAPADTASGSAHSSDSSPSNSSPSASTSNSNQGSDDDRKRRTQVDPANHAGDHNSTLNPLLPVPQQPATFERLPLPSSLALDTDLGVGAGTAPTAA